MGFRGMYLGGGWAVRVHEGQVRRRVVGGFLGIRRILNFLGGGVGKRGKLVKNHRLAMRTTERRKIFLRFGGKYVNVNEKVSHTLMNF